MSMFDEEMPMSPPPPPARKRGLPGWALAAIVAGVLIILCCVGGSIYLLSNDDPKPAPTPAPTPTAASPATTAPNPPPTSPGGSANPASPDPDLSPTAQKRPATIDNGEWQAGVDFPLGRYETVAKADNCVWQVTTGQGESVHYVDPGHIGPGHYTFTFKAGETLHTVSCGIWTKTG